MSVLKLKDENGNWIGVPSIKGEAGATPHIGENGNWWIGNIDTNIQAQGDSGVYTGSGDAPENYDIQIDLDGEPLLYDPVAATKDMTSPVGVDNEGKLWASSTPDLSGYVTDAELENALANIPTGGDEWRLARTVVIEEDKITSITVTTDDDGNPLNFRECCIEWYNPKAPNVSLGYFTFETDNGSVSYNSLGNLAYTDKDMYGLWGFRALGDFLYGEYTNADTKTHYGQNVVRNPSLRLCGKIKSVTMRTDGRAAIANGATFKLYVKE